tara:strand:- start:1731 stop:3176 length:1446 start_codon:yes stop_codon:yes gene_type:complete
MPVRKVQGGYRWGNSGKVYPTKAQAERQGRAIYASGYQDGGITEVNQDDDPGIAGRIGSFLRNVGRGREQPEWRRKILEQVERGEIPRSYYHLMSQEMPADISPSQALWGAGLLTGVGGVADAAGYYPEPPSREASIYEMLTAPSMPSVKEHWQTGHPYIAGLQSVGAVFPGAAYLKAASRPLRRGIASIEGAEPLVEGVSELIDPARRQFLKQAGLATAGIAALGAGVGKVASGAKAGAAAAAAKAAAPVARGAAKVGQLTQRANINKFHDFMVADVNEFIDLMSEMLPVREAQKLRAERGNPLEVRSWRSSLTPESWRHQRTVAGEPTGRYSMIPEKARDWLKEDFGLDTRDYHVISDELGAADTHRVSLIENSPETIVDSFVVNGQKINLHEIHGVPVVEAPGIWSYVPNEAGLRKLELHQIKQAMGDDLPDSLIENTSQYFRDEGTGFLPGGRGAQEYIEDAHGIPIEKYTDIPLAE